MTKSKTTMKTEASAVATNEHHQQILQVGNGKSLNLKMAGPGKESK